MDSDGDLIAEAAWEIALREYGSGDPTQDELQAIEELMFDGPDRGAAVILAAIVEKSLEKLIANNIIQDRLGGLFAYSGPIGTFSAKTQMAYSLGLIGQKTRYDLKVIRLLRNQFAHSRRAIEFTMDVIRVPCGRLNLPDLEGVHLNFNMLNKVSDARLQQASDKTHPRTRYFTACNEIAQRIYFIRGGDAANPLNDLP